MSFYDINTDPLAYELMPVEHRDDNTTSLVKALLKAMQWVQNIFFDQYRKGVTYLPYSPGTYNQHDLVLYERKLYVSLEGSNTSLPTDTTKWSIVLQNHVGMNQRILADGSKIKLEYYLNNLYQTTYRQPPNIPDIYVETNTVEPSVFFVGYTEDESSAIGYDGSDDYIVESYVVSTQKMATIWFPLAVYTAIDSDSTKREGVVRSIIDKIITQGITYNINTY